MSTALDSLYVLAHSFRDENTDIRSLESMYDFMRAYLTNGEISRAKPRPMTDMDDIYAASFQTMNRGSNRQATKPRDYVLATMPQFPWYNVPANVKLMSFSSIFNDFHYQSWRTGHGFACRFTRSMTEKGCTIRKDAWQPNQHQPEPSCLGDFLKLMGERLNDDPSEESCFFTTVVKATTISNTPNLDNTLSAVETAIHFSELVWAESHQSGELSKYGSSPDTDRDMEHLRDVIETYSRPDVQNLSEEERQAYVSKLKRDLEALRAKRFDEDWILPQARRILAHFWGAVSEIRVNIPMKSDWIVIKEGIKDSWTPRLQHVFLLLAAMVSCHVPLSAVVWADEHFVPVHLEFAENLKILGLLSKHACSFKTAIGESFLCVGRHWDGEASGMDLVLVHPRIKVPVGLIPDFLHRKRTEAEYMERMKILFWGLDPIVGPRTSMIRRVPLDAISISQR